MILSIDENTHLTARLRKQKRGRALFLVNSFVFLGLAVGLMLFALSNQIRFFYTPSDLMTKVVLPGDYFRLGGMVKKGSLEYLGGGRLRFSLTDTATEVTVLFTGLRPLPDLFAEGQGVVAEGRLDHGVFVADRLLAKHDETYMPRAMAKALKQKGERENEGRMAQKTDRGK